MFTWKVSKGTCSDQVDVQISNNSFIVSLGPDVEKCATSTNLPAVELSAGTGKWSVTSGPGQIANISQYNSQVTDLGDNLMSNIFKWTVTNKFMIKEFNED